MPENDGLPKVKTLAGRILDSFGNPLAGVELIRGGRLLRLVNPSSRADGSFRLSAVRTGVVQPSYRILTERGIIMEGQVGQSRHYCWGDQDVLFVLQRPEQVKVAWEALIF